MTDSQKTVSQLRKSVIALVEVQFPEDEKKQENPIRTAAYQYQYDTVDIACSVLQFSPDFDPVPPLQEVIHNLEQLGTSPYQSEEVRFILTQLKQRIQSVLDNCIEFLRVEHHEQDKSSIPSHQHLFETVFVANGQLMAESIRLFLESFGIQAILARESAGVVLGLTVGTLGEADINVAPEDAEDARLLLQAMQDGLFASPEYDEAEEISIDEDDSSDLL